MIARWRRSFSTGSRPRGRETAWFLVQNPGLLGDASTASLRVPQVVIETMTDAQVEQYLVSTGSDRRGGFGQEHSTGAITDGERRIWSQLRGTPQPR